MYLYDGLSLPGESVCGAGQAGGRAGSQRGVSGSDQFGVFCCLRRRPASERGDRRPGESIPFRDAGLGVYGGNQSDFGLSDQRNGVYDSLGSEWLLSVHVLEHPAAPAVLPHARGPAEKRLCRDVHLFRDGLSVQLDRSELAVSGVYLPALLPCARLDCPGFDTGLVRTFPESAHYCRCRGTSDRAASAADCPGVYAGPAVLHLPALYAGRGDSGGGCVLAADDFYQRAGFGRKFAAASGTGAPCEAGGGLPGPGAADQTGRQCAAGHDSDTDRCLCCGGGSGPDGFQDLAVYRRFDCSFDCCGKRRQLVYDFLSASLLFRT